MPAVSKAQQRFMGMVHAVQKGDMEAPSKEVEKAADSISDKDAKDYASTSHKGLPDKKENMITRNRLKEIVKEVMVEEAEYQAFFKKALEKAGKGINDMSDAEKKAFFNKIDTAWNGRGEKNEELTGGQHKLDVDKDGDIEGDDLADLRAGKTNENKKQILKKKSLSEAKNVDVSGLVNKIEKHTDRNAHTEAVIELAKFLKEKSMENILNSIMDIHMEMGSMPIELSKLRTQVLGELMKLVKNKYGNDIYKQINSAY